MNTPKRVLLVGGAGYIGSVLARQLLHAGHRVRVFDALFYGTQSLTGVLGHPNYELVIGDTRNTAALGDALTGVDAVVHLGELVGDPACGLEPSTTRAINRDATRRLAELAYEHGIRRFVYPSSCSVYGASDEIVDEESPVNPMSLYAEMKVAAEHLLGTLAGDDFEPVVLRLATVFGYSARPRFDLVVNLMAARALAERRISVHGGGQWRPFVHVSDVAAAMAMCLDASAHLVAGRIFNLGSDRENYTIAQIAGLVHRHTPEASIEIVPADDRRNYRVSFSRIQGKLGFVPAVEVTQGIAEIQDAIRAQLVLDYGASTHSNVRSLQETAASYRNDVSAVRTARVAPRTAGRSTASRARQRPGEAGVRARPIAGHRAVRRLAIDRPAIDADLRRPPTP